MSVRAVSLLPSGTELLCALGVRPVGRSHECDFPPGLEEVPVLTSARIGPLPSSQAIDRAVRDVLEDALAIYDIDVERLRAARPQVIVTQDLCEVCAVSLDDVRSAVARLAGQDVAIVSLHPTRLEDLFGDLQRVAAALDAASATHAPSAQSTPSAPSAHSAQSASSAQSTPSAQAAPSAQSAPLAQSEPSGSPDFSGRARLLVAGLRARVADLARRAAALPRRPRVLTIEWISPVMIGGLWMPELVTLAGGEPLVTRPGEHAPTLDRDALAALDPDVVLVKPCGFSLPRTLEELDVLRAALPNSWRARLYATDGNAYFNRSGPRLVESLEILAACVHPEAFPDFALKHASSLAPL